MSRAEIATGHKERVVLLRVEYTRILKGKVCHEYGASHYSIRFEGIRFRTTEGFFKRPTSAGGLS